LEFRVTLRMASLVILMPALWGVVSVNLRPVIALVLAAGLLAVPAVAVPAVSAAAVTDPTTRVSVATGGTQGNDFSCCQAVSADGRYVAFRSNASNLVAGDTNGFGDEFVRDTTTGATTRISVATNGTQANEHSHGAGISADGRYVAYASMASNLVAGDTNAASDVFVRDQVAGTTTRVSTASDGTQGNSDSGPGGAAISANGRYVAFISYASNLVAGDTNGSPDVFVHDMVTGATTRVSVASDGTQGNDYSWHVPALSADGRYVAFYSSASNLVAGDTNDMTDVFVRDRTAGTTTRVSVATAGTQANNNSRTVAISPDGSTVAFASDATNLVAGDTNAVTDVFAHNMATGVTTRVSVATGGAQANNTSDATTISENPPSISADGRLVAFSSDASNLVAGDTNAQTDVFVRDQVAGTTTRVSLANDGSQATGGPSYAPTITPDGAYLTFTSLATNLVAGDTNSTYDVFVRRLGAVSATVTVTNPGTQTNTAGSPLSVPIQATDTTTGATLSYAATGLPPGLAISSGTGVISGTPSTAGSYSVTVTATDGTSASGSATFTWVIQALGTLPGAPTGVSATAGNGQAAVTWTAPASNGGSPITGYTITSSPACPACTGLSTTGVSSTVSGLTNGTAYTFTVTATNAIGTSSASTPSTAVTPSSTIPGAPTGVTATAGNGQVQVSWTAPASNGGSPITGYTVIANPGGASATTTGALTATVPGLTNGTSYTFTVTATNATGPSAASTPSAPVTPSATGVPVLVGNPLVPRTDVTDGADGNFVVLKNATMPMGTLSNFQTWNPGGINVGQTFRAYVLRPTGVTNGYTVIYESGVYTVPTPSVATGAVSTFTVSPAVAVAAGDVIGYYGKGVPFTIGTGSDTLCFPVYSTPTTGATMTLGVSPGYPIYPQIRTYSLAATITTSG
jgi:Putative Ig domain/Fibronectin type III domain/WD40-like Beta Propeller Repeat